MEEPAQARAPSKWIQRGGGLDKRRVFGVMNGDRMSSRRIKFVWGNRARIRARWRWGLWGEYARGEGRTGLAISVPGLLRWSGAAALAGYLLLATALFLWFERRPDNLITYADTLLLPWRQERVRELRGRMMIADGLADAAAQRWNEAAMKLRVGLARAPHHVPGRLTLARYYLLANRRAGAIAVLTEALEHGYPGRELLELLFRTAADGEDHELVAETGERLLSVAGSDREWLLQQRLQALLRAGQPAEALAAAVAEGDSASVATQEVRVLALLELGRLEEAEVFLDTWSGVAPPEARARVLQLRMRVSRANRRPAELVAMWEELRAMAPGDPQVHAFAMVQRALAGDPRGAAAALEDYFLRFASVPEHLVTVADALGEAGQVALMQRCIERAAEQGFPLRSLQLGLLQRQVTTGDWSAAARTLEALGPSLGGAPPAEAFAAGWLGWLLRAAAEEDPAAGRSLLALLEERPLPAALFRQTGGVLLQAGRYAVAREVVGLGLRSYPTHAGLLAQHAEAEHGVEARQDGFRSPRTTPAMAVEEAEFFVRLERWAAAGDWGGAAEAIRQVRVNKPAWLATREGEVLEWQMRVARRTGDALELLGAAKLYLNGQRAHALQVLELARELGQAGERETAALLVNEVLRKYAGFPPALRLRRELQLAAAAAPDARPAD